MKRYANRLLPTWVVHLRCLDRRQPGAMIMLDAAKITTEAAARAAAIAEAGGPLWEVTALSFQKIPND